MRDFIKYLFILLLLAGNSYAAAGEWSDASTVDRLSRASHGTDLSEDLSISSAEGFPPGPVSNRYGLGYETSDGSVPILGYKESSAQRKWFDTHTHLIMDEDGLVLRTSTLRFYCGELGFEEERSEVIDVMCDRNPYYEYTFGSIGHSLPELTLYIFDEEERNLKNYVGKINLFYSEKSLDDFRYARFIAPAKRGKGYGTQLLGGLRNLFIFWQSLGAPIESLTGEIEATNLPSLASNIKTGFNPIAFLEDPEKTFIPKILCSFYTKGAVAPEVKEYEYFPKMTFAERMGVIVPFMDKYFEEWFKEEFNPLNKVHHTLYDEVHKLIMTPNDEEFNRVLSYIRTISDIF